MQDLTAYLRLKKSYAQIVPSESLPEKAVLVKSLVWIYDRRPLILVLDVRRSVDTKKLGEMLGSPASSIVMADPNDLADITGYKINTIPPLGHIQPYRTIIDESLLQKNEDAKETTVYGGSGDLNFKLQISVSELVQLSSAQVGHFSDTVRSDMKKSLLARKSERNLEKRKFQSSQELKMDLTSTLDVKEEVTSNDISSNASANNVNAPQAEDSGAAAKPAGKSKYPRIARSKDTGKFMAMLDVLTPNEVNQREEASGKCLIHWTAWQGPLPHVRAFVERGADINIWSTGSGNYGKTAIFYALTRCRDDVVVELIALGAKVRHLYIC
jgi:prolyl-tRNA editing enzyme YbaK/EbsC (Cys-tRNA(Pro) deacylase)